MMLVGCLLMLLLLLLRLLLLWFQFCCVLELGRLDAAAVNHPF